MGRIDLGKEIMGLGFTMLHLRCLLNIPMEACAAAPEPVHNNYSPGALQLK